MGYEGNRFLNYRVMSEKETHRPGVVETRNTLTLTTRFAVRRG